MDPRARIKIYGFLADSVIFVHFLWTLLVFGGAIAMLFLPSFALPQIVIISITLLSNIPFRAECPLTVLERKLRRKSNPTSAPRASFTTRCVSRIFGTTFRERTVNIAIGAFYVLFYIGATLILIYK